MTSHDPERQCHDPDTFKAFRSLAFLATVLYFVNCQTEECKLYSRLFRIFLPNIIKIGRYNFELYRFKVDAFFETVYNLVQWYKLIEAYMYSE